MKFVVLGCGKLKQPPGWRGPIVDLYVGRLYLARLEEARRLGGPHLVVSAFFGPRLPAFEAHPYDRTLTEPPGSDREVRRWFAATVEMVVREMTAPGDVVVALASRPYVEGWADRIRAIGLVVETPLAGLGIGQQLGALNRRRRDVQIPMLEA